MKGILPLFFLFITSGLFAVSDGRFDPIFGNLVQGTRTLTAVQVHALLDLAARESWNLFDLLDEVTLYLKPRGLRAEVPGPLLRAETSFFDLGDNRVDTLVPLGVLTGFAVGARNGTDADIEVHLSRAVSGFLELGDFVLDTKYGFRDAGDHVLAGAFGVTVKNGLFTWTLQKIARVPDPTGGASPNFVAIHLNNFFRPKRWLIDPVKRLSAPPSKP